MTDTMKRAPASEFKITKPSGLSQFFTAFMAQKAVPAAFSFLCKFKPVLRVPFSKLVVVTSFDYVQEVCARHNDFPVPYGRQVDFLGWDPNFLLAMKDTPDYWETMERVKQLWLREDLERVREISKNLSEKILAEKAGKLDVMQDLMIPVTEEVIAKYYGVDVPLADRPRFMAATMTVSGFLFGPQIFSDKSVANAQSAFAVVTETIQAAIDKAKTEPLPDNTIIGRNMKLKIATDKQLVSYLIGMITGYLPTNTLANGRAINLIMNNKDAYNFGVNAAKEGDRKKVLKTVMEALRLNYMLPALWRYAPEAQTLGAGTGKDIKIKKDALIYFSNMSAMKDKRRIPNPKKFDPNRPDDVYLVYGYQFHWCVGAYIANTMMEEIFTALLAREPKIAKRMQFNGNFPWNMQLSYKKEG